MIANLVSVAPDEYSRLFPTPSTAFGSVEFNMLNSAKVSRIEFLAGLDSDSRPVMGIIVGLRDGVWRSPFSAPMAALSWHRDASLATIAEFFSRVKEYLAPQPLRIALPPTFVAPDMLTKISGTLINIASDVVVEYNYHYSLSQFADFEAHLTPAARNKYHRAQKAGFTFESVDLARAYAVIAANRTAKGYYLAMTLADLEATSSIIDIDSFILRHGDSDVAAAIIYRIAPGIAHVVYWGDAPGFERLRPMNILPYHVFNFYHALCFQTVSLGTASTDGIPNYGLCDYKASLGCATTLIPTVTIHNSCCASAKAMT